MSTSADRAAALRAQADALDDESRFEEELLEAKEAYTANPTEQNKAAKDDAAQALVDCRVKRRSAGVSVGGDAYVDEED